MKYNVFRRFYVSEISHLTSLLTNGDLFGWSSWSVTLGRSVEIWSCCMILMNLQYIDANVGIFWTYLIVSKCNTINKLSFWYNLWELMLQEQSDSWNCVLKFTAIETSTLKKKIPILSIVFGVTIKLLYNSKFGCICTSANTCVWCFVLNLFIHILEKQHRILYVFLFSSPLLLLLPPFLLVEQRSHPGF